MSRIELLTSPLPMECSTTEPHGHTSNTGAGEGNRTLVVSLEGFCSTIELHPHGDSLHTITALNSGGGGWIRTSVGVSQQIYSLPPLATRAPLRRELTIMRLTPLIVNTGTCFSPAYIEGFRRTGHHLRHPVSRIILAWTRAQSVGLRGRMAVVETQKPHLVGWGFCLK